MFKSSYLREVRKEKYEHSDEFEDQGEAGSEASFCSSSMVPGLESLQELNSRFARYINRARVLEQRNAVFRKQLETLQHMEEEAGLEELFSEQISTNQERIHELQAERTKLERELKDAECMLEEFSDRLAPTLHTQFAKNMNISMFMYAKFEKNYYLMLSKINIHISLHIKIYVAGC